MINLQEKREEIEANIQAARNYTAPWRDRILLRRRLYNLVHYDDSGNEGEVRYPDPTYTNTVDLAVGILMANNQQWHVHGWKPSATEMSESSSVEKYLAGVLDVNRFREGYDHKYELTLNFVRDGMGVLYSVWDPRIDVDSRVEVEVVQGTEPAARSAFREPPLRVQVIDPVEISVLPGGEQRWSVVIRDIQDTVYNVQRQYGVVLPEFQSMSRLEQMNARVTVTDYWEECEDFTEITTEGIGGIDTQGTPKLAKKSKRVLVHAILSSSGVLLMDPEVVEGYKAIPYEIGFYKPIDRNDPENWGQSIIDPLIDSVRLLERSINRRQYQIDVYASLPMVSRTTNGRQILPSAGMPAIIPLNKDEELAFPIWPGNAPDVQTQIEHFRSRIQQSGFSDVMYGSGANSVSGYALSQLGDQNRIRFEQPIAHLEMMWGHWARKVLDLTAHFGKGMLIQVYGHLRGVDFTDMMEAGNADKYMARCEIVPEFPNERVRNHAMATQVQGILSQYTIMERYLGIQQPDDERERKLIEMAEQHPVMMQYLLNQKLVEKAKAGDVAAAYTLQQLQSQSAPQAGAAPGANPEQLTGLQSPTGQPPPQAMGQPAPTQPQETVGGFFADMGGGVNVA